MSDHDLDDLVRLYRSHAREAPAPHIDSHVLAMATQAAHRRRALPGWRWLAVGMAASLALWCSMHEREADTPVALQAATTPISRQGYDAGRTQNFLLTMDIDPPPSPVARALRDPTRTP